jgi:hypothetical protein
VKFSFEYLKQSLVACSSGLIEETNYIFVEKGVDFLSDVKGIFRMKALFRLLFHGKSMLNCVYNKLELVEFVGFINMSLVRIKFS